MEQSAFIKHIQKYFNGIVLAAVEKLNDTLNPLTYLHRRILGVDYSITGKWESLATFNTAIMADVIAMDSSIPLKKRDKIQKATGDIPKMGMELQLNETELTNLYTLARTPGREQQMLRALFQDTPRVITGVYERLEDMLLQGLSTGQAEAFDNENVGAPVRVDYGFPVANRFGVIATIWAGNPTTAKPFDDIERILNKASADGNRIVRCFIEKSAFDALAATEQAKQLFAFISLGFAGDKTIIPTPTLAQVNNFTLSRYGFVFEIVDRSVRYEINGIQTSKKPFAAGALTFVSSERIGSVVYATLAEEDAPVAGVSYTKANEYILVSKFRQNRPALAEITNSQARVLPVISGVNSIYTLDSTQIQA